MPKLIPLSTFKDLFSSQADLITADGIEVFKRKLNEAGSLIAEQNGFSIEEYINFQHTLINPTNIVFYGWIEQQESLLNVLLGQELVRFEDRPRHLEHNLANEFKKFLSPFLAEALLGQAIKDDEERRDALSYVQLLDLDHRAVVESKLVDSISDRLKKAKTIIKESGDEQVLINTIKPLCCDEIIECVNYLSRASYALKLDYVDQVLAFIRVKSCTARFANWMLKRMERVELHKEHAYKITDLRKELSSGDLKVRNHAKGRTPIRWKTIGMTFFVVTVSALVFWILYFQPFSDPAANDFADNTSFKEFSEAERIRIDSMLQEMDHQSDLREIDIDPMAYGTGATLTLRKAFKNPTMERIYEDLCMDSDLKESYPQDSCKTSAKHLQFKRAGGVIDLKKKVGKYEAMIKNESDYDVIIYISDNTNGGAVHSMYLANGSSEVFKISMFNTVVIVAGEAYQAFEAPFGAIPGDLPSENFKHHFCTTDENYPETINTAYKFTRPRSGVNKFMVKGSRSGFVHLIDIHQVLAEY